MLGFLQSLGCDIGSAWNGMRALTPLVGLQVGLAALELESMSLSLMQYAEFSRSYTNTM